MSSLLTLKSLTEVLSAVLAKGNRLVTAGRLDMILAKHIPRLVEVLGVSFQGSIQVVDLLIDEAELQINACELRMVLSDGGLENSE